MCEALQIDHGSREGISVVENVKQLQEEIKQALLGPPRLVQVSQPEELGPVHVFFL